MLKHAPHLLVLHLRERWIHHQDQPDCNRDGCRSNTKSVQKRNYAWNQVAEPNARRHGGEDPQR